MFPARGKTNSLSLRTSAMLVMGTCITVRLRAQELRRDVVNLLSLKVTVTDDENIDLPSPKINDLQMIDVEMPKDLEFGGIQVDFDLSGRPEEITMREDFKLQIQQDVDDGFSCITYEEAMKGMESLGEWEKLQPNLTATQSPKRRTELDEEENPYGAANAEYLTEIQTKDQAGAGTMSPKRRTTSVLQLQLTTIQETADFAMDVPAPPAKAKNQSVPPVIEVTPAVENGERNQFPKRLTSPVILDMDVDEERQAVSRREKSMDKTRPQEVAIPMDDMGLLPPPTPISKKRKRQQLVIDPIISISGEALKEGLVISAMTMESDQIRVDAVGQNNKFSFQTAGRTLGRLLSKEYVDAVRRSRKETVVSQSVLGIAEENHLEVDDQAAENPRTTSEIEPTKRTSFEQTRNGSTENDNRSIDLSTTTTSTSERWSRNLDQSVAAAQIEIDPRATLTSLQEETDAQNILPRQALSPVPGNEIPQKVQLSPPRPETNMMNSQEAEEEINSMVVAENRKETPNIVDTLNVLREKATDEKDQDDGGIRCHFSDICSGRPRRVVAKNFFNLLALEKTGNVESLQEKPFEEIAVKIL